MAEPGSRAGHPRRRVLASPRRFRSRTSIRWSGGSRPTSSPPSTKSPSAPPGTPPTSRGTGCGPRTSRPSSASVLMYWFSVLANFDASGPAVFARATIHAFEQHEEDPVRKCFFSITRDEMNHEECCQRSIAKRAAMAGRAVGLAAGHRRWSGPRTTTSAGSITTAAGTGTATTRRSVPLPVLFTSRRMGEMAASTLFRGMASGTAPGVLGDVPADRPGRVAPPADLRRSWRTSGRA